MTVVRVIGWCDRNVQQPLEVEHRELAVIYRLHDQRLDVRAFDFGPKHVVARGASRLLELLDLRRARRRQLEIASAGFPRFASVNSTCM